MPEVQRVVKVSEHLRNLRATDSVRCCVEFPVLPMLQRCRHRGVPALRFNRVGWWSGGTAATQRLTLKGVIDVPELARPPTKFRARLLYLLRGARAMVQVI